MNEWMLGEMRCVRPRRARGFWRRQFADAPTPAQRKFDVTFGVVAPTLCLVLDPLVFRGGVPVLGGGALYEDFQFYAYTISAVEMVALCAWMCVARGGGGRPAALAGMLLAGAAFSLLVGLAILPYSVIGILFFLVGLLGFVPFLTAFVFLRNAWRAAATLGRGAVGSPARAALALACGFVFALGAPAVAQVSLTNEVEAAMADVRAGRGLSPRRLRALRVAAAASGSAAYDGLVWEYDGERDPARRARLARAYAEITVGGDIERRLAILRD